MNEPELFGRPSAGGLAPWPPTATPTASALGHLEARPSRRISYDWKFFAVAAVIVAIGVALAFVALSFTS